MDLSAETVMRIAEIAFEQILAGDWLVLKIALGVAAGIVLADAFKTFDRMTVIDGRSGVLAILCVLLVAVFWPVFKVIFKLLWIVSDYYL